jgi:glucose-6-phosphate isomerase
MKKINLDHQKTSLVTAQEFDSFAHELTPELKRINKILAQGYEAAYETAYASLNVPSDHAILESVQAVIESKKALEPSALVLVGIGGSNLGTIAVHEALNGLFYNEKNPTIKLYCADTVDTDKLNDQRLLVEQELKKGKNIILNVVTKSGSTTETIANFELFLNLLKKYKPDNYQSSVVVTTDKGSKFAAYAKGQKFSVLEIPPRVGGRYSIFTAVGLFPLGLLGINITQLCAGARDIMPQCVDMNVAKNPAATSALLKYILYQQHIMINDLFVFSTSLISFGLWYRQLMGESIGKEFNRNNQRVEVGITPTVSVGSTDLHSVGQLYLGGPRDKFTTFITVEQQKTDLKVPNMPEFEPFVAQIQGKKFSTIMDAILKGVQLAYANGQRPFNTVTLPVLDEATIGQLLQMYMVEMMYLGYLFDVNPFDQPNVESYKQETRRILENE